MSTPADESEGLADAPPHERRLTFRAYEYWASVAGERKMPALGELQGEGFDPFRGNSFLIGFAGDDYLAAEFRFVGEAIAAETGLVPPGTSIRAVPQASLLSRLADYYLQAIAHEAPVGFEAEYERGDGADILYRGILLPLSEDGEKVDHMIGVLSWKTVPAGSRARPGTDAADARARSAGEAEEEIGLQGALAACRAAAERLKGFEARSRDTLYLVLAKAYAFFLLTEMQPETYAVLLRQAGLGWQARAPFTPVFKLIFGRDYDKARITEYAAALAHVRRRGVPAEGVRDFIAGFEGGLKGLVAAERAARRAERGDVRDDRLERARRRLVSRPRLAFEDDAVVAPGEDDFVLLLARRRSVRLVEPVAILRENATGIERALRRAAAEDEEGKEG